MGHDCAEQEIEWKVLETFPKKSRKSSKFENSSTVKTFDH